MATKRFFVNINLNGNQLIAARYENSATFPTGPGPGQTFFNTADNRFYGWNGSAWVDLSQVINSPITIRDDINNAGTNPAFPASPTTGDSYFITTQGGSVGGLSVEIGDQLIYGKSGWFVLQRNLQAATTAIAGFVRLATQQEIINASDATTAISPAGLAAFLLNFLYSRKFRINIASLAANTATTITHGLNVANPADVVTAVYQDGAEIVVDIKPTTANALTIESNQALGNVTLVVVG
jgi:hypothetical protein